MTQETTDREAARRARRLSKLAPLAFTLSLTGCFSPYVPPSTGPQATIDVDMNNVEGDASLNLGLPAEHTLMHSVLTNSAGAGEAKTTTTVPADQYLLFYYGESVGTASCAVNVRIITRPDQTYEIFVGDTPPAPRGNTWLDKIFSHAPNYGGSKCYFRAFQKLSDGTLQQIPLYRW